MDHSMHSADANGRPLALSGGHARETQSFRGLVIGIAVSALLWAPLGVVAMRLL